MSTTRNQRTLAGTATVAGFGYWSGHDVTLEFRPAEPHAGIVFVRRDLAGCPRVPARIDCRVETPRRSSLMHGGASVEMVEHVTAALAGLRIDNCEVWSDAAEMPGCDGSAKAFIEALDAAGIEEQPYRRSRRVLVSTVCVEEGKSRVEAHPGRADALRLRYHLDYGEESPIGRQTFELDVTPDSFRTELAPCRTFMLQEEADWLLGQGLGLRASPRDLLVFDRRGPIDNQLRFPDECVRHKLLDMVGDLALLGCDLVGRLSACRSGHRLNAALVRAVEANTQLLEQRRHCA